MRQVYVIAEGQTEEAFIRDTLSAYLEPFGVNLTAVVLKTKRLRSGKAFKGGVTSWTQIQREVRSLLGAAQATGVTTMLDLYGLPPDFPGQPSRPSQARAAVNHLERCARDAIGDSRFIPYLSMHEFEALLFSDPRVVARRAGSPEIELRLQVALSDCGEPELVDDSPASAPSKRIIDAWPRYAKTTDGPVIAAAIGIARLRERCPHFDAWIGTLELL